MSKLDRVTVGPIEYTEPTFVAGQKVVTSVMAGEYIVERLEDTTLVIRDPLFRTFRILRTQVIESPGYAPTGAPVDRT